jgi:hypothetical protein
MRVGPKGLERAIHDVYSACGPCSEALEELVRLLGDALPSPRGLDALAAFARQRMAEADAALELATRQPMTAKHRLALEQVLGKVLPDLEAARDLLELLAEAAWAPALASPIRDLLSIRSAGELPERARLEVKLDPSLALYELELPPSLTQGCLSLLATEYRQRHGRGPVFQCRPQGDDLWLELNSSETPGSVLIWSRQPLIPPSLEVSAAALEARGCTVHLGDPPRILLSKELVRSRGTDP